MFGAIWQHVPRNRYGNEQVQLPSALRLNQRQKYLASNDIGLGLKETPG